MNATVSNLTSGAILSWDERENALPLPIDSSDPVVALALKSSDVISAIDNETLQVTGLTAPKYALTIDKKPVATLSSQDLAAGINLATLPTPMLAQAGQVLALTNQHVGIHTTRFRSVLAPLQFDAYPEVQQALSRLVAALDDEDASWVTKQRAAAQPIVHHFSLAPAQ